MSYPDLCHISPFAFKLIGSRRQCNYSRVDRWLFNKPPGLHKDTGKDYELKGSESDFILPLATSAI